MDNVTRAIEAARHAAKLSRGALAERTGISQPALNRILSGERVAKLPELKLIADTVGCTIAQFMGSDLASQVQSDVRGTHGASNGMMRQELLHFMELDAYLDDQAISA